ncbi:MAG: anaerobic sulfatase maturase [Candidatus Aminicenantes bacterium RBG_16_63_16]|nr:MAG: anaerobic sulfatase maturase [Candidatus Aminicenantes bacterium RBG_16_63_16]
MSHVGPTIRPFHVLAKPTGARCNCACDYCFFLKKERLYPGSEFRMPDEVMESFVRQTIEAHAGLPEVEIAWQGGEPTLMGIDFFHRAVEAEARYARAGQRVSNSLQTNGLLIDEEWCRFLRENGFLVGLSLDGPRELHDAYRRDKAGASVFDRAVRAARLMREHGVAFNILATVNAANSPHPLEVYRFFRDELRARYLQLIPIVERENETGDREGTRLTERSVEPAAYGRFLIAIFDEWVRRDVGTMFVTFFDSVLAAYVCGESTVCALRRECGEALALEHNGDLYACDHFVEPRHLLGNIMSEPVGLAGLVASEKQRAFGRAKQATLPRVCRECRFLFICNGECPKNRVLASPDGEPGLNGLCAGLKAFFAHTEGTMREMAGLLARGLPASGVMGVRKAIPRGGRGRPRGRAR